jgi:hypothetical protein
MTIEVTSIKAKSVFRWDGPERSASKISNAGLNMIKMIEPIARPILPVLGVAFFRRGGAAVAVWGGAILSSLQIESNRFVPLFL